MGPIARGACVHLVKSAVMSLVSRVFFQLPSEFVGKLVRDGWLANQPTSQPASHLH